MATTKFKDMPVHLSGDFIATGAAAPDFELVKTDLGTLSLSSLKGKRVILNIFPSLDTGVCAMSVRKFNQLAASLPDTVVLAISKDLPFAHARFCTVEGIENLVPLSDFRHSDFDENYGVLMADGPLQGLLARSVVVIDREGKVVYTELVPEITQEPDYDRAVESFLGCRPPCRIYSSIGRNFSFGAPQRGQCQSAGSSSKGVPGTIPCFGSPAAGS